MKNKIKMLIIPLIFLLTGCFNYNELNNLAIVTALGVDLTDDEYLVSIQVVNTQKGGSDTNTNTNNSKFTIYEGHGNTIEEALKDVSYTCPKKVYLNHLEILIFSEDVAKNGINDTLDYIFRNIEMRGDFLVFVSKNKEANETLKIITPIDTINSKNIVNLLMESSNMLGKSISINFNDLIKSYLNHNKEIAIPSISVIGNDSGQNVDNIYDTDPNTYLKITETAIFKRDKLLGYINNNDTLGYNIINDSIKETIIQYQCDNGYIEALINNLDTSIKINKNKLLIDIEINGKGNLSEVSCNINLENVKELEKIESNTELEIKKIVNKTIDNIQENFNSDIFGFLDLYYKNDTSYYKLIKDDWYKNNFRDLNFNIKVNIDLIGKGNTLKVINDEK